MIFWDEKILRNRPKKKDYCQKNIFEPNKVICDIGVHKRRTLGLGEIDDIRKKSR